MSGIGTSASAALIGVSLLLHDHGEMGDSLINTGLTGVSLIAMSVCYGAGFGPVVFSLLGEILPPRVSSTFCSIVIAFR